MHDSSGFSRVGLLMDRRALTPVADIEADTASVIELLERHNLTEVEVDSDDDIGSDCSGSDDED
ncbi:hypothetical protein PF005_g14760 [Phytophthora fragariae]|uniref:Uncharacterized protein n=1 Tax=Phytophthora fragariae TaxID=53985 RepID=A0A6A3XH85_9STRA|nr:hypothetical protein PF009_g17014 [Phytophthora fragariae]KAE8981133.1 hypothetical protein PF011_g22150 [Phytophthora fragariae]KAE9085112.1 hypothetical protein PF010_g20579 [Phytophthora fragariae]KAE9093505.1 hypothetical protein PF007_g18106 [Phytophthora fragariae]KAE9201938.1 hypothetical protein PF005_g14760 [Phytophthora fragariae]